MLISPRVKAIAHAAETGKLDSVGGRVACPKGHWTAETWNPLRRCKPVYKGEIQLPRRWVIIAGDSNSRRTYRALANRLKLVARPSEPSDNSWTGQERWDSETGFRLSFRFVPYVELRPDSYTTATFLVNHPQLAYKYSSNDTLKYNMPRNVVGNREKPDVVRASDVRWGIAFVG